MTFLAIAENVTNIYIMSRYKISRHNAARKNKNDKKWAIKNGVRFLSYVFYDRITLMREINKRTLEHLAELARIELDKKNKEKLLKDLRKILEYFEELNEIDTAEVEPMTGGNIFLENVFREDDSALIDADETQISADKKISENLRSNQRKSALREQFPEKENGFLKAPSVFE